VQALRQGSEEREVGPEVVVAEESDSLVHPVRDDGPGEVEGVVVGSTPEQDGAAGACDHWEIHISFRRCPLFIVSAVAGQGWRSPMSMVPPRRDAPSSPWTHW